MARGSNLQRCGRAVQACGHGRWRLPTPMGGKTPLHRRGTQEADALQHNETPCAVPLVCRVLTKPAWKASQMLRRGWSSALRPGWLAGEQHEDGVGQLHLRAVPLELQCLLQLPCTPRTPGLHRWPPTMVRSGTAPACLQSAGRHCASWPSVCEGTVLCEGTSLFEGTSRTNPELGRGGCLAKATAKCA